ncbi:MAG: hypothetical protein U5L45_08080 [Saprospiraceae bacterium]|nr:hypothetical protein [Saprospiraceae bacterium]
MLASLARRWERGSFFGLCPKNEPRLLSLRAKRAIDTSNTILKMRHKSKRRLAYTIHRQEFCA